uniref:Uncharacterized protein n=1 Tax=Arundo donax TaxID=35708 RepID=A0A0A9EAC9_ARUDO
MDPRSKERSQLYYQTKATEAARN